VGVDAPVLWHLKVSNYNEKARWALDYKPIPHVRRAAVPGRHRSIAQWLTMLPDADLTLGTFFPDLGSARRLSARAAFPAMRRRMAAAHAIDEPRVERAFEKVRAAGERFRAELEPSGYLVGERFTVADLTLASLVAPAVAPEQFPYPQPQRGHPRLAPLRVVLAEPGLLDWTRELYARCRGRSAELMVKGSRARSALTPS